MRPTILDYRDLLNDYGFTATGQTIFHSPARQILLTVVDPEGPSVTVQAMTGDRARLVRWEVHVHGAPTDVLDAAVRAAEPTLTRS